MVGPEPGGDLVPGAALGPATAVKFTGALLAPSYLVARFLAPGPRVGRVLVAGLVAAALAIAVTPYALIHADAYLDGVRVQMGAHYKGRALAPSYSSQIGFYLSVIPEAFGPVGSVLLAAGLVLALRDWRTWAPLVAHPLTTLAVLASAELRYERHLVPTAGILALVAARAVAALAERRPRTACAVTALAAAFPLAASLSYVRQIAQPSTKDLALDAVTARLPVGARVVNGVPDLGFDAERLEVLNETRWEPNGRLLARDADLVVWPALGDLPPQLAIVTLLRSPDRYGGAPIALARLAAPPAYQPVPLAARAVSASENASATGALVDGRLDTLWQTEGPQRPDQWLEVTLPRPLTLGRVTLALGDDPTLFGQNLHLYATEDGTTWRRLPVVAGRAPVERQLGATRSQVLLVDPTPARGVRIVQVGRRKKPWAVAELHVDALSESSR